MLVNQMNHPLLISDLSPLPFASGKGSHTPVLIEVAWFSFLVSVLPTVLVGIDERRCINVNEKMVIAFSIARRLKIRMRLGQPAAFATRRLGAFNPVCRGIYHRVILDEAEA